VQPADVQDTSLETYIQTIINVLLGLIGVVAVIMLIYGGFRYVLSAGNEKATSAAKDTILFAIIGIVVAVLAFAIVNFVIGSL
jgi:TRAP-type C4-dicarboxylate transport system permease small subunit